MKKFLSMTVLLLIIVLAGCQKDQTTKSKQKTNTNDAKVVKTEKLETMSYEDFYENLKEEEWNDLDIIQVADQKITAVTGNYFLVLNENKKNHTYKINKIIDDNKDKLKNPTCATCIHLHDQEWAKRYGKVCFSIWQVCDHYINPNSKYNRKQKTYVRRPSNKACPNYEYGDDNFENRRRCIKEKNTQ